MQALKNLLLYSNKYMHKLGKRVALSCSKTISVEEEVEITKKILLLNVFSKVLHK